MRAVVQRVSEASVGVSGEAKGSIGPGMVVLLGVGKDDSEKDADYLAEKISGLRIFEDGEGRMNLCAGDAGAEVLVVSQFTLYGDCRRGRRPSYSRAAGGDFAEDLYELFVSGVRERGLRVETGVFGADMEVRIVNSGPVTLLLDSSKEF